MKKTERKERHIFAAEQILRIRDLLESALLTTSKIGDSRANLRVLKEELEKARIVEAKKLPADVVRVGSWIEIEDLEDGSLQQLQLVYPESADLPHQRISVMTPLGIAVVGRRQEDRVEYVAPGGTTLVLIRRVSDTPFASGGVALSSGEEPARENEKSAGEDEEFAGENEQ